MENEFSYFITFFDPLEMLSFHRKFIARRGLSLPSVPRALIPGLEIKQPHGCINAHACVQVVENTRISVCAYMYFNKHTHTHTVHAYTHT